MTANGFVQLALFVVVLLALAKPLGRVHGPRLRGPAAAGWTACSGRSSG